MPFVFTVEDGTGLLPGANSYADVLFAEDYFTVDPQAIAAWILLTTLQQQAVLVWATRVLDQKCFYYGIKTVSSSPLRWPRNYTVDKDANAIGKNVVPLQLKQATCEVVKFLLTNDPTTGVDVDRIKRITADVVSIEFQDGTSQSSVPSIINAILSGIGYYQIAGNQSFGRIVK
jgi:hypothetical protein